MHELQLTDEADARPGTTVDRCAAIAFFEFKEGGLLVGGDTVIIAGKEIGTLVGFDETHMPNHLNIVLYGTERRTGLQWGLAGGDLVVVEPGPEEKKDMIG